jgi:hypothetical protein
MKPFLTLAETHTPDGSRFTLHEHDGECYSVEAHFCPAGAATAEMISATAREKASKKLSCSELPNPLSRSNGYIAQITGRSRPHSPPN